MARGEKSYNPFTMWGSYVGAVGLILAFYIEFNTLFWLSNVLSVPGFISSMYFSSDLAGYIAQTISGFIIGWGIHSLFRRFA